MDRKYKRYQYSDVPIPRTTAYRRRLKMRLRERQEEKMLHDGELSKKTENELQHDAENVDPQNTDFNHEYFRGENMVVNQTDHEQQVNLEGTESSDFVETFCCDKNIPINVLSSADRCDQVTDKNHASISTNHSQECLGSFQDEQHISAPETLPTASSLSPEDDGCYVQQDLLDEADEQQSPILMDTRCKCTDTTVGDALVMCLALGYRHNLSWEVLIDTLRLINNLFKDPVIPASKYFLLRYMERGHESTVYHLYCQMCELYLGKKSDLSENMITCQCGYNMKSSSAESCFLSVNLRDQLKNLFEKPGISKALNYRFEREKVNDDAMEDIYDGDMYKKLSAPGEILSSPFNFSYTFNTDGIPFGKSSKKTIWPIYITINELPPKDRAKHMLLAGIWVGDKDPNMGIFLKPFVDDANVLSTEGFSWACNGKEVHSKVIPLCAVVDSVARCRMLNMGRARLFMKQTVE